MTIDSSYFDPTPASPFDDELTLGQKLAQTLSPNSAQSLVPSPPDSPPPSQPGQSTPRTGSLATPPQQAVAKNMDTAAGRQSYNVQPAQPLQPVQSASGSVQPASNPYGVQPVNPNQVAANTPQPAGPAARLDNRQVVVRDSNGASVGSAPMHAMPALRPAIASALAARMGNGSAAPSLQPVPAATGAVQPARSAQPLTQAQPQSSAQPLQPVQGATGALQPVQGASMNPGPGAPLRPGGSSSGPMPVQPAAPSQMQLDQSRLNNLVNSGSGVSQIKNPWLRGFARAGDIAESIIAPGAAALTPGTTFHNRMLIGQQQGIVANDTAQAQSAAAIADTQSQADERRAKMAQDIANAGKADRWDPNSVKTVNTAEGVKAFNPDTNQWDVIGGSPDKPQEGERPLGSTVPNLNKTLADRYQVLNPGKSLPPQYVLPATATQKDYDRIDKALAGVEGAQGTQAQRQTANAARAQAQAALEANRAAQGNAGLDRETARMAKPYETANSAASTQLDKIDDARAMINGNAESQALGIPKVLTALVGGQGTGVRITTPELNAISTARGWGGDLQGKINQISGKGKLTATQQQQLTQIIDDVKARITQKRQITNDALDKINGASSRDDVIAADKEARQRLGDLESGKTSGAKSSTGDFNWNDHPKVSP